MLAFTGPRLSTALSHGTTYRLSDRLLLLVPCMHLHSDKLSNTLCCPPRTGESNAIDRHRDASRTNIHAASQASFARHHSDIRAGVLCL